MKKLWHALIRKREKSWKETLTWENAAWNGHFDSATGQTSLPPPFGAVTLHFMAKKGKLQSDWEEKIDAALNRVRTLSVEHLPAIKRALYAQAQTCCRDIDYGITASDVSGFEDGDDLTEINLAYFGVTGPDIEIKPEWGNHLLISQERQEAGFAADLSLYPPWEDEHGLTFHFSADGQFRREE